MRLTDRNAHGKAILKMLPNYEEYDPINKLAYYEDLEEQGRLLVLPEEQEDDDGYPCYGHDCYDKGNYHISCTECPFHKTI